MERILVPILMLLSSFGFSQDQWLLKDSVKGSPRSVASSYVLNGEAFIIGGLDTDGFRRKIHKYKYWENDWIESSSIGGPNGGGLNRGSACAFAINNKGYVCLGQGETNPFFKDLWEYDPITDAWSQKADFIGTPRRQAVSFVIDQKAFVGTGKDENGFCRDMFQYDPSTNSWIQMNDFGGTARKDAVAFSMGAQAYIGTGDDGVYRNDFWLYDAITDSWIPKANFPGTPRKGAVAWGQFPQGFICSGEDMNFEYKKDLWEYNYYSNSWQQRTDLPGNGRTEAIAFVLNNVAFVGSGYNGEFLDDVYAYQREVGLNELSNGKILQAFPNPTNNEFHLTVENKATTIKILNIQGKDVSSNFAITKTGKGYTMQSTKAQKGLYFIHITDNDKNELYTAEIILQ